MGKWKILIGVLLVVVGLDVFTKQWALYALDFGETIYILGLPITLTFNEGGGFSLTLGEYSRWIFSFIATGILAGLIVFFHKTPSSIKLRLWALSLISSGAIGNLIDRLRWDRGVVDFIGPIDLGFMLWPIFNVADSAVSIGGLLLVISLWKKEPLQKMQNQQGQENTSGLGEEAQ